MGSNVLVRATVRNPIVPTEIGTPAAVWLNELIHRPLLPTTRLIGVIVANASGYRGVSTISPREIIGVSHLTRETVYGGLAALERAGFLKIERQGKRIARFVLTAPIAGGAA